MLLRPAIARVKPMKDKSSASAVRLFASFLACTLACIDCRELRVNPRMSKAVVNVEAVDHEENIVVTHH